MRSCSDEVVIDGESLTIEDVVNVARKLKKVRVADEALKKVEACRKILEEKIIKASVRCYGVTTGFGPLGRVFHRA